MLFSLNLLGIVSVAYLVLGVFVTSKFYPGYSHSKQFMSELGASGSPTQQLSPIINNYPLALMFCAFGWSILLKSEEDFTEQLVGASIIIHGLATAFAGLFPMDRDPYTPKASLRGQIHGLAGMFVMISLIVAPCSVLFSGSYSIVFKVFSIVCVLLTLLFLALMIKAYKEHKLSGLFQRLCYGSQLVWLAGLSVRNEMLLTLINS